MQFLTEDRRGTVSSLGVVIPTHRGSALLSRSMTSLAGQTVTRDVHVVVAVNDARADSYDRAAELAPALRDAGLTCRVVRTPQGRSAALRTADRLLPAGARLYLDQDAALSPGAVATLLTVLAPGTGIHFAAPGMRLAPARSAVTRAYFRIWRDLPYVRRSPATCGVYAVSAEGRSRWDEVPDLHSDDKWVRWHFAPEERRVLAAEWYEVVAPDGPADLVRARRRYHRGNRELVGLAARPPYPDDHIRHRGIVRSLLSNPPAAAVFLAVHAAGRLTPGRAHGD
ncbi:glycosyltransferase family 2 protein [Actinoplanes sp. DH11]|uniref:glycosyltransferase family 2 protein n=1 Tax=Actinoplanes sp. DH11 TaxID=2857011 RepID=UPI001E4B7DD8|nr:glycosyltransferase [Actinoplanes sp. DH11]